VSAPVALCATKFTGTRGGGETEHGFKKERAGIQPFIEECITRTKSRMESSGVTSGGAGCKKLGGHVTGGEGGQEAQKVKKRLF